ncbi:hypothetical protein L861_14100 [Litchfieldella anticariensis FP35 = DSM 16096]|uniref:Uncharacterized protein n=1 Tax=Litchfieldella anticariensis (strain DSM 16096 / CECT 5854 / CIP 108499 / LMG 22089 / FP35) TaxID=1121939 RepID=S2KE08_LITA3|nr:hypothetical protein L861_14100 [Halomonas anticariensis FP35 = DSM 16096]
MFARRLLVVDKAKQMAKITTYLRTITSHSGMLNFKGEHA